MQRAFQIGLYRSAPSAELAPLEAGIRTRTWWMVFMMDKLVIRESYKLGDN